MLRKYYLLILGMVLIASLLVGLFLRVSKLESLPDGLFVDETSILYNAWSVAETGKDEHGIDYPVFFQAFGEFKKPLYIYSMVLGFKIWPGLTEVPRFLSVVWGLLGILSITWLSYLLSQRKIVPLFSAALLGLMPVHLVLSRVIFEVITYPVLYFVSLCCLWMFESQKKYWGLYIFVLLQGLTIYSYTSALVIAPLLVAGAVFFYRQRLQIGHWLIALGIFITTVTPLLWWENQFPGSTLSRFYTVTSITNNWGVEVLFSRAIKHITPTFLFVKADENLRHSLSNHGVLPWSALPVLGLGMYVLLKTRQNLFLNWLLFALVIGLLPVVVSSQTPHVLRSIGWWMNLPVVCVIGFSYLVKHKPVWSMVLGGMLFLESFWIGRDFFTIYPGSSQVWFEADTISALEVAKESKEPYFISDKLYPGTMISWAWIKQIPADDYQNGNTQSTLTHFGENSYYLPGTYVFSYDECLELPEWFKENARKFSLNQSYTCVYVY